MEYEEKIKTLEAEMLVCSAIIRALLKEAGKSPETHKAIADARRDINAYSDVNPDQAAVIHEALLRFAMVWGAPNPAM